MNLNFSPRLVRTVIVLSFFSLLLLPTKTTWADDQADIAAYKRKVNADITHLQEKIAEVREDYKEDGIRLEQKIQKYADEIAELKRESEKEIDAKDLKAAEKRAEMDKRRVSVRQNFTEWRLRRAINNYGDKIEDVKVKAEYEMDESKKIELNEKIQKLDAKYNTAKAKLKDLKATDGANWDTLEAELDASLKEIDRDYDEIKAAQKMNE